MPEEILGKRELYWIDMFNTLEHGYNYDHTGKKVSESTKKKVQIGER